MSYMQPYQPIDMSFQFNVPSEKTIKPLHKQIGSPNKKELSTKPSEYMSNITAASKIYLKKPEQNSPMRSQAKGKGFTTQKDSKSTF